MMVMLWDNEYSNNVIENNVHPRRHMAHLNVVLHYFVILAKNEEIPRSVADRGSGDRYGAG